MTLIGEYVLTRLHNSILLPWRTQITSRLIFFSKTRKGNIEIALFAFGLKVATQDSQSGVLEHTNNITGRGVKNQIIDFREMNICLTNTAVEVDPS